MDVRPHQRQEPCGAETIERFLAGQLSDAEATAFERHLGECSACRRELEVRAADESWWSAARDCLAPSTLPLASAEGRGEGFRLPLPLGEGRGEGFRLPLPLGEGRGEGPSLNGPPLDGPAEGTQSWPRPAEAAVDGALLLAAIKPFLNPTDDPRMLGRVGNYEVAGIIGSGGNGVVLKGFDAALSRNVAIKLLSPRLADSGAARRRFSREAQAAAAVVHDNVMAIHAVAETHGLPYLVMPYVRGPSLESRLRTRGPLALEEVLRVGRQVAAGLAAAHAQGLVHRDIKPANILLEEGVERVKITDFGLARAVDDASLTRSGVIAGTPQYMSPEQARGEPLDHRADLFSLGCVLYAACAGRSPFRAETSYGVLRKICESEPRDLRELNPAVPLWLVRLVERLLAKEPSQRFDSAAEVADLLEECLAHVQQPARMALPESLLERDRRRKSYSPAITVAIILLLVGGGIAAWKGPPAPHEEPTRRAGGVSPPVQHAAAAAPAAGQDARWDDSIDELLTRLSSDVERLRAADADDLWNDSLTGQIERLKNDANELKAQISESAPSTPSQEKQP
ncbi:MAG TPA: protein kinase [Pirellulales bacterium]|nr:protein kinase [Pirellulales bacterium]